MSSSAGMAPSQAAVRAQDTRASPAAMQQQQRRRSPTAVLLFLLVLVQGRDAAAAPEPTAARESVADVILGLYSALAEPVHKATSDLVNVGLKRVAEVRGVRLPACKRTDVLLNAGGWPRDWGQLTPGEQASHPINLVLMQLAFAVYRPPDDEAMDCLGGMGLQPRSLNVVSRAVPHFATTKRAFVFRAGSERVFVVLRGSCEPGDIAVNTACRQVAPGDGLFGGAPGGTSIGVHRGFMSAWEALEPGVVAAVQGLLAQMPPGRKELHIVGHSLGAAVGAIAALRLNMLLPGSVAGVWLFAAPRPGCPAFADAYDRALRNVTLRVSSWRDFATHAPVTSQSCALGDGDLLLSLDSATARFNYTNVGRALLMCPDATGLTDFRLTDEQDCPGNDNELDASGATHQLGHYADAWRRGHYKLHGGDTLSNDTRLAAVMCDGCAAKHYTFWLQQISAPARMGGPVTCAIDASCGRVPFAAAVMVGGVATAEWSEGLMCSGFMCTTSGSPGGSQQ